MADQPKEVTRESTILDLATALKEAGEIGETRRTYNQAARFLENAKSLNNPRAKQTRFRHIRTVGDLLDQPDIKHTLYMEEGSGRASVNALIGYLADQGLHPTPSIPALKPTDPILDLADAMRPMEEMKYREAACDLYALERSRNVPKNMTIGDLLSKPSTLEKAGTMIAIQDFFRAHDIEMGQGRGR